MQKSFSYAATNSSVTITNTDRKFEHHQLGTRRMPVRTMMKLEDNDARYDMVVTIIERRLAKTIAEKGGA